MAIQLDGNQLKDFIKEQVRQVLTAHAELQDECGVTVIPRFKMRFSALVVANGGLNAIPRSSASVSNGEKISVSEEGTEANETTGTETQDVRSKETGAQGTRGENHEEGSTGTTGSEHSATRTDGSTSEDTEGKETQHSTQNQSQGTTQTTTTNYTR